MIQTYCGDTELFLPMIVLVIMAMLVTVCHRINHTTGRHTTVRHWSNGGRCSCTRRRPSAPATARVFNSNYDHHDHRRPVKFKSCRKLMDECSLCKGSDRHRTTDGVYCEIVSLFLYWFHTRSEHWCSHFDIIFSIWHTFAQDDLGEAPGALGVPWPVTPRWIFFVESGLFWNGLENNEVLLTYIGIPRDELAPQPRRRQ